MERLTAEVRGSAGPRFLDDQAPQWEGNRTMFPHDATGRTAIEDATRTDGDSWHAHDDPVLAECRRLLSGGVPLDELMRVDARVSAIADEALSRARAAPVAPPEAALADVVAAP
jgi:hypothetical protein